MTDPPVLRRKLALTLFPRDFERQRCVTNDDQSVAFRNLEIFSLITKLLGVEGSEPTHNGTLGFWDRYLGF